MQPQSGRRWSPGISSSHENECWCCFGSSKEVSSKALATLVVNKLRGILDVAAIKAPGFGERRMALLKEIVIVTVMPSWSPPLVSHTGGVVSYSACTRNLELLPVSSPTMSPSSYCRSQLRPADPAAGHIPELLLDTTPTC